MRFYSPDTVLAAYQVVAAEILSAHKQQAEHPDYEQLAAYLDGELDSKLRADLLAHIKLCEDCDGLCKEMTGEPSLMLTQSDQGRQEASLFPRLRAVIRPSAAVATIWRPAAVAAALLVLLLSGIASWVMVFRSRSRIEQLQTQADRLERENESLRQEAAASRLAKKERKEQEASVMSETAAVLADGKHQISLSDSGVLTGLESVPENYREMVRTALKDGRVLVAAAPVVHIGLLSPSARGQANKGEFQVLYPVNFVVESTRPTFRWRPVSGSSAYTVFIRDIGTGKETESEALTAASWTPTTPLIRGHTYAWMVSTIVDGQRLRAPAPNRPFAGLKVLDGNSAQEVDRARREYGGSHLIMGTIYAKAGLKAQARTEFKALATDNPLSDLARKLLASIK